MPSPKSHKSPKFLQSLYDILHNEDAAILAWSVDGSCFQVFDIPRLENEVLPKYFKHGKFTSLQRQLNNFGFRKWTKTRASVCTFSHDVLRRCDPLDLLDMIANTAGATAVFATTALGVGEKRPRSDSTATVVSDLSSSIPTKKAKVTTTTESLCDLLLESMEMADVLDELQNLPGLEHELADDELAVAELLDGLDEQQLIELDWENVVDGLRSAQPFGDATTELSMLTELDVLLALDEASNNQSLVVEAQNAPYCGLFSALEEFNASELLL